MSAITARLATRLGALCRNAAAALVAGVWRKASVAEVRDRLAALPVRDQVAIVGGILTALLLLSLLAAQFGIVGMLVFWLTVVVIVN